MKCPKGCAASSRVIDSREVLAGAATRRRRQCRRCAARFTTYERRSRLREGAPASPDPSEVLHLRAALALHQRGDLPTEARMLTTAALARDWKQCEQIAALVIVILSSTPEAEAARRDANA
jgi:trimethylamine:corrinoid methyltransferase-like protein